jgi:hypothetical protein
VGGSQTERCWLVERTYTDRDLVVVVYATPDGERSLRKELAASMLDRTTVTAAIEADPDDLTPVGDPESRSRYETEADRVRDARDPDEPV